MRRLALLPLALLAFACASSSSKDFGIPNRTTDDCEHGEVEVRAGLNIGVPMRGESMSDRLTFNVEVANNARRDIVVKLIRISPSPNQNATYEIDSTSGRFNETIPENEEHLFEIPIFGRSVGLESNRSYGSDQLDVVVLVTLEGGEEYRCHFGIRYR
jgi:hypothetical protein